jgi:hypothetical protein
VSSVVEIFMIKSIRNIGLFFLSILAMCSITIAQETVKKFDISNFSEVELNASLDLHIQIADHFSVEAIGDEGRVETVVLDRRGDELSISTRNGRFGWFGRKSSGALSVNITMPELEEITLNGSGDAEVIGLDSREITLNLHGSGDLYVTGHSDDVEIEIHGSGDLEMDEVTGENVDIEIHGSGNVDFSGGTCNDLTIEIEGSGDVDARNLICHSAKIDVEGSGNTRIHVTDRVVFDGEGSGRLDVFGNPGEVVDEAAKRNSKIRIR